MTDGDGTPEKLGVAELFLFDAGDTFLPSHMVRDEDRPRWEATAAFIVERYNAQGVAAMSLGDKDLGLGRSVLQGLVKAAKFPILAANVVDIKTNKGVFQSWAMIERGGVKIGVIGLLSDTRTSVLAQRLGAEGIIVKPPAEAMNALLSEINAAGADFWVVLSQLNAREETEISEAFPFIRAFLGGDGMSAPQEPLPSGSAWSFGGGQKGKQVSVAIVDFQAPTGPNTPWNLGDRKALAERQLAESVARIKQLETQLEKLAPPPEQGVEVPLPTDGSPGPRVTEVRRKQLETQLVHARTTEQMAQVEIAEAAKVGDGPGNAIQIKVFPMGRGMPDGEADGEAVKAFRLKWPAPPGH